MPRFNLSLPAIMCSFVPVAIAWFGCNDHFEDVALSEQAIIGGTVSIPGAWPWQAAISAGSIPLYCGGSLVAPDWVLTAAHCTFDQNGNDLTSNPGTFKVTLGDFDITVHETSEQVRMVDKVLRNPDYPGDPVIGHNDTALLHLSSPATLTAAVSPIRPATGNDAPGLAVTATGWGWIDSSGDTDSRLRQVSTSLQAASTCNPFFGGGRNMYPDEICMGTSNGNVATCHGDSGGAIVTERSPGHWEEIGLVSWGRTFCTSYSVAARISSHVAWIRRYVFDASILSQSNLIGLL